MIELLIVLLKELECADGGLSFEQERIFNEIYELIGAPQLKM